jgi:hypothetical protein
MCKLRALLKLDLHKETARPTGQIFSVPLGTNYSLWPGSVPGKKPQPHSHWSTSTGQPARRPIVPTQTSP